MQNERAGLIAATLQSGVPVYFPKKLSSHKPGDYFRKERAAAAPADPERRNENIFAVMTAWCAGDRK